MTPKLIAHVAHSWSDLEPLVPVWESLDPSPFASPAMAQSWLCAHQDTTKAFALAVLDDGGRLHAMAPWAIVRSASGAGHLTGIGGDYAQEHDPVLAAHADPEAVAAAIADAVRRNRLSWDVVELNFRADGCGPLLYHLAKIGWLRFKHQEWRDRPIADLTEGWDAFNASRSNEYRGNVRRRASRLSKEPHRYIEADASNVEALLATLFDLHATRWTERDWRPYHALIRDLSLEALSRGALYLHALEIRGAVAALLLVIRRADRAYMVMQAFDPEWAGFSAGTLVTHRCLERVAGDGVRTVDMGPGDSEWKRRLQSREIAMVQPTVARLDSPAGLSHVAWVGLMKPWLKVQAAATLRCGRTSYGTFRSALKPT